MPIGHAISRLDGLAKVSGRARFTADGVTTEALSGVIIASRIARGAIARIDTQAAEDVDGVAAVFTHANFPRLVDPQPTPDSAGQSVLPLQTDRVDHVGQPVALVLARTPQIAEHAASLVRVEYSAEEHRVVPDDMFGVAQAHLLADHAVCVGADPETAQANPVDPVTEVYSTPVEHHQPIEPLCVTVAWVGDSLVISTPTQWLTGVQAYVAACLGIPRAKVRVRSEFVCGSFGSIRVTWPCVILAAAAARAVGGPVHIVLSRRQMFTMAGHRPLTHQRLTLRFEANGKLAALSHDVVSSTSQHDDFADPAASRAKMIYACPSIRATRAIARLDLPAPTAMRAPGEARAGRANLNTLQRG